MEEYQDSAPNSYIDLVLKDSSAKSESAAISPTEARRKTCFSTASDGRVTFTFPSSRSMNGRRQSFPRQARYDKSPGNELTGGGNQNGSAASTPLRLMTDESLASALNTPGSQPPASPNPGGNDLEACIESSKRTIVHGGGESGKQQSEAAPS